MTAGGVEHKSMDDIGGRVWCGMGIEAERLGRLGRAWAWACITLRDRYTGGALSGDATPGMHHA